MTLRAGSDTIHDPWTGLTVRRRNTPRHVRQRCQYDEVDRVSSASEQPLNVLEFHLDIRRAAMIALP